MLLIGLEEVVLGIHKSPDDETINSKDIYVLNSKTGGPTEFQIQNLTAEQSKTYGGDAARRSSGRGTGNINGSFNVDDFPSEVIHAILGMKKTDEGIWYSDAETEPPYVSAKIKTHGGDGKAIWMALPKVKFSRGDVNPKTNTEKQSDSSDQLTYQAIMRQYDKKSYFEGLETEGVTQDAMDVAVFGQKVNYPVIASPVTPAG